MVEYVKEMVKRQEEINQVIERNIEHNEKKYIENIIKTQKQSKSSQETECMLKVLCQQENLKSYINSTRAHSECWKH